LQQTINVTFRADYHITPELSIQYYGSPFASSGEFTNFKLINNPMAKEFSDRFHLLGGDNSDIDQFADVWGLKNPEFTFTQFRSNLVFRWEYLPGSKIYLVWANERTLFQQESTKKITSAFNGLGQVFPCNVFLIKINYWFSL